ncbi:hypothetical protein U1Q18_004887 [Sarracenia purpurea var. burkii]
MSSLELFEVFWRCPPIWYRCSSSVNGFHIAVAVLELYFPECQGYPSVAAEAASAVSVEDFLTARRHNRRRRSRAEKRECDREKEDGRRREGEEREEFGSNFRRHRRPKTGHPPPQLPLHSAMSSPKKLHRTPREKRG